MTQWEYIVVGEVDAGNWGRLTSMGLEGWEAVAVLQQPTNAGRSAINSVLMKRPTQQPAVIAAQELTMV